MILYRSSTVLEIRRFRKEKIEVLIFRKRALQLVALLWKMTCNLYGMILYRSSTVLEIRRFRKEEIESRDKEELESRDKEELES